YTVISDVGKGGMGRVYSASASDGTLRALKLLSSERFVIGVTERNRFIREVEIARSIEHRSLVRAFDVIEHQGTLVAVMELLPGENLEHRLSKGVPSKEVGLRWMTELAAGLAALHTKGIVHRDISAKNALL